MPKFVRTTEGADDVLFAAFGTIGRGQDPKKTYLVKEGETIEGVVTEIKDSTTYKKIYTLEVKGAAKPVVILGKTDLRNKMGHGATPTDITVEVNDIVRITFLQKKKTQKGHDWYDFDVEVAKA